MKIVEKQDQNTRQNIKYICLPNPTLFEVKGPQALATLFLLTQLNCRASVGTVAFEQPPLPSYHNSAQALLYL